MFDHMSGASVYADLVMQGSADARLFLVVEGVEDQRVLESHLSHGDCLLFVAHGKLNALEALERAETAGLKHVIGLVDSDIQSGGSDPEVALTNTVTTDMNDLDSEIFHIPGLLRHLAYSQCESRKLRKRLGGLDDKEIMDAVYRVIEPVTAIRIHLLTLDLSPRFRDMPLGAMYAKGKITIKVDEFCAMVASRTPDPNVDILFVSDWLSQYESAPDKLKRLHNGHHLFATLHAIFRHEGEYRFRAETLVAAARAAVTWENLSQLPFITRITELARARGYRVWRNELRESEPRYA